MDFGNLLADTAMGVGRMQIAGTNQDIRQAQADMMKATAQEHQLQAMAMQQQQQKRELIATELAPDVEGFKQGMKTEADTLQFAKKGAAVSLANNDFEGAKAYEQMGKMAESSIKSALDQQVAEQGRLRESLGSAAQDFVANPTDDQAEKLLEQAMLSGEPMPHATLPDGSPNPEFVQAAKALQYAGLDSGKRIEHKEKLDEIIAKREATIEQQKAETERKIEAERQKALDRQASLEERRWRDKMMLEIRQQTLDARKEAAASKASAHSGGVIEQKTAHTIIRNAAQVERALGNMMAMSSTATSGMFAHLKAGDVKGALTAASGNVVTPEEQQQMGAVGAELGLVLGQIVTAGGGRGVNQTIVNAFQAMASPQVGDTPSMALFRLGNVAEITRLELENILPGGTPQLEANRQHVIKSLMKIPTPQEIMLAVPAGQRSKLMGQYAADLKKTAALRAEGAAQPPAAPTPASTLPPGFKED